MNAPESERREPDAGTPSVSQTVKAVLSLRDLILQGALKPGERLSELAIVERLGVSRTPVRAALIRLEEEGLLQALPNGGFTVKAFSMREIYDAIELRGTLEGLAARLAAERGAAPAQFKEIKRCVEEIDGLIRAPAMTEETFAAYVTLNERFHALLAALADSAPVTRQIERAISLPFASPNALVMAQGALPEAHIVLTVAQEQHRGVVEAIENREGARAEALMREHARLAHRNLQLVLRATGSLDCLPGGALVRLHQS